ncbi:MAG: PepSY-like domain-containing protein [Bacteroidetes bacterium]|nr:PepSY-like domain-containing protein [Bacteroidota bacterium]
MKKLLFMLLLLPLTACGQTDTPPDVVLQAFKKSYPAAQAVDWDKEAEGWEASFRDNGRKVSATFDALGQLIQEERDLLRDELPEPIRHALSLSYPGWSFKEAERITTGKVRTYEVEIRLGGDDVELLFDESGTRLR